MLVAARREATGALETMLTRTKGRVNLLADAWQYISKEHLLGVMFSRFGAYAIPPTGDHHDGLANAEELEESTEASVRWKLGCWRYRHGQCRSMWTYTANVSYSLAVDRLRFWLRARYQQPRQGGAKFYVS